MNPNKTSVTKPLSVLKTSECSNPSVESGLVVSGFNSNMGGVRSGQGADKLTQKTPGKANKRGY